MDESLKEALRKVKKLACDANPKLQQEKRSRVLQYCRGQISGQK